MISVPITEGKRASVTNCLGGTGLRRRKRKIDLNCHNAISHQTIKFHNKMK